MPEIGAKWAALMAADDQSRQISSCAAIKIAQGGLVATILMESGIHMGKVGSEDIGSSA